MHSTKINEKRGYRFEQKKEGYIGMLGGENIRENDVIIISKSNK